MLGANPIESLTSGFLLNLELFVVTLLLALPLGLIITFCSMSRFKPLKWITKVFIWVIRGTPLMLQLFVVLYAPGLLFGIPMSSRFTAAVIAFVINYAAYFSEIYRGGIESISVGQYEAGKVLGMTRSQIFFKVVLLAGGKADRAADEQRDHHSHKGYGSGTSDRYRRDHHERGEIYQNGSDLAAVLHSAVLPCVCRHSLSAVWLD